MRRLASDEGSFFFQVPMADVEVGNPTLEHLGNILANAVAVLHVLFFIYEFFLKVGPWPSCTSCFSSMSSS